MVKVSIIVPVYNVEKYIDRCLKSLVNQTLKDIEILIINDGTPDNSMKVCEKYAKNDNRIKIFNKENEGLGLTRNYGIKRANGEYIAFVDSDDYVALDMCENLYKAAIENKADVVYGGVLYDDSKNIYSKRKIKNKIIWKGKKEIKSLLLDFISTLPSCKNDTIMEVSVWKAIFRKRIFAENNINFVSERQFISEDIIFDIDFFLKAETIVEIPNYVYYYVCNPNSLSKAFRSDRFKKVKILYDKIINKINKYYPSDVWQLRTDRFLISRARTNIKKIIKHRNILGKDKTMEALKEICNDRELQKILHRYPIFKLPFKYAIVAYLIRMKKYKILEIIFRV